MYIFSNCYQYSCYLREGREETRDVREGRREGGKEGRREVQNEGENEKEGGGGGEKEGGERERLGRDLACIFSSFISELV